MSSLVNKPTLFLGVALIFFAVGLSGATSSAGPSSTLDPVVRDTLERWARVTAARAGDADPHDAYVVASTMQAASRLGGWQGPRGGPVYVVEVRGDFRLQHSAPAGGDTVSETSAFTAVFDARTLRVTDLIHGPTELSRLGTPERLFGAR